MGFKKDFIINVQRLTTAVAQRGFGKILILSGEQDHAYEEYTDISDVAVDFLTTTDTYKIAEALFSQKVETIAIVGDLTAVPSELVTKLNETIITNNDWFGLVCTDNSDAAIAALATWIDTQEKVYAVTSQNKAITNASNQTMVAYHPTEYIMEKSLAYMLVQEIGGTDLDGKAINGITSSLINATEYATFKTNHINVAVEKFGNVVIDGGDMAGGEKIDVILGEFWIKIRMEEDLAQLKLNSPKIPYTNAGVALLVDVASNRLKLAARQNIVAIDDAGIPEFTITYLPVEEVPAADRANRKYDYVRWEARLAGAIRTGTIYGALTI